MLNDKTILALVVGVIVGFALLAPTSLQRERTTEVQIAANPHGPASHYGQGMTSADPGQLTLPPALVTMAGDPPATTVSMTMEPSYTPNKALNDDYRCFLLNPKLEEDVFVIGYTVRPEQVALVHHVLLFPVGPESVANAKSVDQAEEGPGWTCFGGPGVAGATGGGLGLGGWVPGATGTVYPKGTGAYLKAGSQIIMQVHYNLNGSNKNRVAPDASKVELTVTSAKEKLIPLQQYVLAAPPELRCPGPYPSDSNNPCNREYALQHVRNSRTAQFLHGVCGSRPEDYINRDIGQGEAQDTSCIYRVRSDGYALGAANHMHLRGKTLKIELNPNTEKAQTLLFNQDWNFNYQQGLWFDKPIPLKAGDTLRITCVYDNSGPIQGPGGDRLEPRYIVWGEGTTDEMCLGGVTWIEAKN